MHEYVHYLLFRKKRNIPSSCVYFVSAYRLKVKETNRTAVKILLYITPKYYINIRCV